MELTTTEDTMTDAMTERLPPYNFSVSRLVSTDQVLPLIQRLISHISSRLGSNDVNLRSIVVGYRNDVSEALLELDIGGDIVDDFFDQFMQPSIFSMLRSVSEYGLLGFQAIKGTDLAEHWHKAVCKSTFVYGSQRMRDFHIKGLTLKDFNTIPMWFKLVAFVADTTIEASFILSINPSNIAACLEKRQRRLEQVSTVTEQAQSWAASFLNMEKQKGSGKQISRETYDNLFLRIRKICGTLGMAQGGETPGLSMVHRRDLFLDLYALTEEAYRTFSATEEGIRIYMLEVRLSGVAAVTGAGVLATCCWQAYSTHALKSMLGVPCSLAWLVNSVLKGYNAQQKENQCRQLAHLIQQTWHAAEETNRFLTWFHTTNHEVAFVGRHGHDWEAYLTEKAGGEVPDDWKGAGYLQAYMRERLDDLKTVEEEMRKSSEMIHKMDNGSE